MCKVNDDKRAECDARISQLKNEYNTELNKLKDIETAKGEVEQLISKAQCAIDNLKDCNFGTDGIDRAVETSQKGYYMKRDYYDEYALKCKNAMTTIDDEITAEVAARDAIPENCGACSECCPPEETYYYGGASLSSVVNSSNGVSQAPMHCFLEGTKIVVKDGYKDIDKLEVNDIVLSYNIETKTNEYKKVTELFHHFNQEDILYSITINDKVIEASSDHRFFIKTNDSYDWLPAKDLIVGNIVKDSNENYLSITNITKKTIIENLYNIEVEDNHNYYVTESEILVHNRK